MQQNVLHGTGVAAAFGLGLVPILDALPEGTPPAVKSACIVGAIGVALLSNLRTAAGALKLFKRRKKHSVGTRPAPGQELK